MKLSIFALVLSSLVAACGASQDQTRPDAPAEVSAAACADEVPVEKLTC